MSKYELIRDIVLRNLENEGNYPTSIEGLYFIRRDTSGEFAKCFYKPACIFVLQGQKQLIFSSKIKNYKKGQDMYYRVRIFLLFAEWIRLLKKSRLLQY